MAEIPPDRLSLVVGVTGHRDIAADNEAPLRAAFRRILEHLRQICPHTPQLVLSGLAAGADSLAAEEAMARDIPVIACLPMPKEEYEKDFSPEELDRFHGLYKRCARIIVTSPGREHGYVATGRFIAQYSHLLVAFWDRVTSRGAGGTKDVIDMRMTGEPWLSEIENIPYLPDVGPVDVIVTPRINGPYPEEPFSVRRLYPKRMAHEETAAQNFNSTLAHIDIYNCDLSRVQATEKPSLETFMRRTDDVANRLQKQTSRFQLALFVIAFLAAAIQIIGHIPAIAKVVGLAAAFIAYWIARRHNYENRYQDYRAIAEGLRVQNAWQGAGLRHRLVDKAYLRMQEGELQWIRMALRSFYVVCCEGLEEHAARLSRSTWEGWIESQIKYYDKARRRERKLARSLSSISVSAIAVGVGCFIGAAIALGKSFPCALSLALCSQGVRRMPDFDLFQNLLTVPLAMAAILGAVFAHYSEKQNLIGNERRYDRMFYVFVRARSELAAIEKGEAGTTQAVLYELGRAALIEHADWLIMRRDRPMKVVVV